MLQVTLHIYHLLSSIQCLCKASRGDAIQIRKQRQGKARITKLANDNVLSLKLTLGHFPPAPDGGLANSSRKKKMLWTSNVQAHKEGRVLDIFESGFPASLGFALSLEADPQQPDQKMKSTALWPWLMDPDGCLLRCRPFRTLHNTHVHTCTHTHPQPMRSLERRRLWSEILVRATLSSNYSQMLVR